MNKRSLNKLANDHWSYIKELIENEHKGTDEIEGLERYIDMVGFYYKSALIHGFKHGVQWKEEQLNATRP